MKGEARKRNGRLGILAYVQVYSIDVILASLSLSAMIIQFAGLTLSPAYWFVIALAIWSVYTADHLVDASMAGGRAVSLRHRVHLKQRTLLTLLMSLAALSSLGLALAFLPPGLVLAGIWLAVGAAAYLVFLLFFSPGKKPFHFKEPLVALIFTMGIWLAPLSLKPSLSGLSVILVLTFITVLSNLILNSSLEAEEDRHSGFASLSQKLGSRGSLAVILIGLAISILTIVLIRLRSDLHAALIPSGLLLLIQIIFLALFSLRLKAHSSVLRFAGDIAFILCLSSLIIL